MIRVRVAVAKSTKIATVVRALSVAVARSIAIWVVLGLSASVRADAQKAVAAPSDVKQVAATPPMGWNSYNCFGSAVHEEEVRANAGYMAKYLAPHGWQYIVVDFLW